MGRALTEILEREFDKTVEIDGEEKRIAAKRFIALKVRELLTTGTTTLAEGKTISLAGKEWSDLLKWLYQHVDGTKELTDTAGKMVIEFGYADGEIEGDFAEAAPGTARHD